MIASPSTGPGTARPTADRVTTRPAQKPPRRASQARAMPRIVADVAASDPTKSDQPHSRRKTQGLMATIFRHFSGDQVRTQPVSVRATSIPAL